MGIKHAACDQYSNMFPSARSSSSQAGSYVQTLLHKTRYGLRATTEMESICNTPIRRIASSTSSFFAERSDGETSPCAASNVVRAVSRENYIRPPTSRQ